MHSPPRKQEDLVNRAWLPYVVLGLALTLTAIATGFVWRAVGLKDEVRFASAIHETREDILSRLNKYTDLLLSGRGFFLSVDNMTLAKFRTFADSVELAERYRGIQGFGYTARFLPQDLEMRVAEFREQGVTGLRVWPDHPREEYHAIVYLEPMDRRNQAAIGYDMYTEPTRAAAMARARDTGMPAASGKVRLVQEIDEQVQPGFLIYVAVYEGRQIPPTVDQRRELLRGFVYSPFRATDLLTGIFGEQRRPEVRFEVYDGTQISSESILYASAPDPGRATLERVVQIDVDGQPWMLRFQTTPVFDAASNRGMVPLVSASGIIISLLLFGITHSQTRAAAALFESESRYRTIFNQAAVGVLQSDLQGGTQDVNQRFCDILGYSREELLQRSLTDLMPPDEHERMEQVKAKLLSGEQQVTLERRYLRRDGQTVWMLVSASLLRDAHGQPQSLLRVIQDINDRKIFEEKLREETRTLETINRVGRSLAAELDLHKLVQSATDAATELTGAQFGAFFYNVIDAKGEAYTLYTISGVPREAFENFPMPRNTPVFDPTFRGEGVVRSDDITKDHRYGKLGPHHGMPKGHLPVRSYLAVPVVARSGETLAGMFFGHEQAGVFTERHEQIVVGIASQASVAIDNARLFRSASEARDAAERANRMKDEFLATLSHELRTPLNAILGWSQLMRGGHLQGDELQHGLETIERNARTQAQLIEDLLDVSRIISGKLRLEVKPVDLAAVVNAALDALRPAAAAREIRLEPMIDPNAGPIHGDAERLQQVVWNLLSNAIKFTPRGGRVQVRVAGVNAHAEIVVSDSGKGIEPQFLPHVFERFTQADSTTTRAHGGLGLGLAIVRHLVELHGGNVRAHSPGANQGATFVVSLPIAAVHVPGEQTPHARAVAEPSNSPPRIDGTAVLESLKVLVLDDEPDARSLISMILQHARAQVITAASVHEAMHVLRRERPDVIISDIAMPQRDGYDFIRQLRAMPPEQGGRIPAVALTAYARSEDRTAALLAGFQSHLAKPVNPTELIAVVANLAGRFPTHYNQPQ